MIQSMSSTLSAPHTFTAHHPGRAAMSASEDTTPAGREVGFAVDEEVSERTSGRCHACIARTIDARGSCFRPRH